MFSPSTIFHHFKPTRAITFPSSAPQNLPKKKDLGLNSNLLPNTPSSPTPPNQPNQHPPTPFNLQGTWLHPESPRPKGLRRLHGWVPAGRNSSHRHSAARDGGLGLVPPWKHSDLTNLPGGKCRWKTNDDDSVELCDIWSKVAIRENGIESFIGKLFNRYINPYYWVHDHPLLHRNNGSLETARVKIRIIHWFKNSCSKFQKAFVILLMAQKSGDHQLR